MEYFLRPGCCHQLVSLPILALFFAFGQSCAAEIDDQTWCATLVRALDVIDKATLPDARTYILNVMDALDTAHTQRGEPGIMAPLTDEGETGLAAMTGEHCRLYPQETVYNAAAFVYRGNRDIEVQFGTAR